jgi:hypothetical protein
VQFSDGVDEPAVAKLLALTRVHMPESRLATLLAAASFFDRAHRPLVEPYYETLISAFVRTANVSAIGNSCSNFRQAVPCSLPSMRFV